MGFITLDDRSGRIEASLFAEAFNTGAARRCRPMPWWWSG